MNIMRGVGLGNGLCPYKALCVRCSAVVALVFFKFFFYIFVFISDSLDRWPCFLCFMLMTARLGSARKVGPD